MNDQIFAQFHALPISVKNVVSSPEGMAAIETLEERYDVVLAELILRLIVRDVSLDELSGELEKKQGMLPEQAQALVAELEKGLLSPLLSYLKKAKPAVAAPDVARQTPIPHPAQQVRVPDSAMTATKVADVRPAPPANLPVAPESTQNKQPTTINKRQVTTSPVRPPQVEPALPAAFPIRSSAPDPQMMHEAQSLPGIALQQLERGRKSEYFMSAEDEEEVEQHRKRLATYAAPVVLSDEIEKSIAALVAKFHLTFTAPAMERRFCSIVASRLHNARSRTALQEMLQRSMKIGGMQYDARLAEQVAAEADKQAVLLHDLRTLTQPTTDNKQQATNFPQATEVTGDRLSGKAGPGFAGQITNYELQKEGQLVAPSQTPVPIKQELVPAQRAPEPIVAPATIVPLAPTVPSTQQEQAVPARQPMVRRLQATPDPDRPFLQDIRHPAKPMDLTDELGAMTIQDFRKLGSMTEAAQKVLQKVALLTEESFLRRSEGIRQWRESDVYQQYLGIGRDSMISGKTVEQIIDDRQRQNVPTLSLEEFSAVADLNRQMRL